MVEIPTTVKNEEVAEGLALATVPYEGEVGFTFPGVFGALATAYFSKYGATREDLMNITIKKPQQRAAQQKSPVSHDNSGYHERPQRKCQRDSAPCGHAYLQGDRGHQQGSGGPQGAENKDGQYLRLRKGIKSFNRIDLALIPGLRKAVGTTNRSVAGCKQQDGFFFGLRRAVRG